MNPRRLLPVWLRAVPGLRWPWLLSVSGVCAAGVWLGRAADQEDTLALLLLLAPLLPLVWVAVSYGGKADPFAPVVRTTPAGGLRLLLLRTGVVLAICLPLLAATGLTGLSGSLWAAAWLVPCLTLTLATLVLSSYLGCLLGAGAVAITWLLAVSSLTRLSMRVDGHVASWRRVLLEVLMDLLDFGAQFLWALASGVLILLLTIRRESFDDLRSR
ncbi:hypothetical protein ACFWDQ_22165 [Streptomyces sp. NPDC060053]|uniref:hypothetical protein n=1 Tax=Streptomyces sp. NPDC060053 TaxID=3347047 RepID=UPI0036BD0A81